MRLPIIVLFLLSATCIKAQLSIFNLSLTDSTQNIFYIGVDNIIKISGKQYDPVKHHTRIIGGGGTLLKKAKGVYIVKVQNETDHCQVWLSENNKSVFKQNYVVRKVGNIVHNYGGSIDSTATIDQLLATPFLFIGIPNSYFKHDFTITSFSAVFMKKDSDSTTTITASGNLITSEQKEIIKKLSPGDSIVFEKIYCVGPDNRRRLRTPIIIKIK